MKARELLEIMHEGMMVTVIEGEFGNIKKFHFMNEKVSDISRFEMLETLEVNFMRPEMENSGMLNLHIYVRGE